jgi:FixJ family two-component response regulator
MQTSADPQRAQLTVYVVDDDPAIRDALSLSLSLRGYHIAQFASAEDFLQAHDASWAGCVIADIRMPGMSGLQMQAALSERRSKLPVVIITGHGDVNSARAAFRGHAIDFLEKPFDDEQLISAIEVMQFLLRGLHAKEIGEALGISHRTVEVHKAHIMEKMGVRSVVEMVRLTAGVAP